ncbi:hypothetical protein CAPTEDRAFT_205488 [Capitella teleta]|uniref:Nucleotide-diphospho-sugar transferase domain-containing protein n=1 Tax=Capitella teleta TaxID=283909 RepID=R7TB77_CAPTE|nr:hypothetical protein CAPTEDRAFT_205488 [Capitella teleta]|eukprot:ELT88259.1 hypothetical protein CAPTEDRAFT_205488 [Capitella teleta]
MAKCNRLSWGVVVIGLVVGMYAALCVIYKLDSLLAKWETVREISNFVHKTISANVVDIDIETIGPNFLPRICDNTYATTCGLSGIFGDLRSALEYQASTDNVVFLAGLVDGGYVDFAVNLHIMSIAPHNICNILYIVIDKTTLSTTQQYNMPVYYHNISITNKVVGKYMSPAFREKSKIKLDITEMALSMGFTVLLTDLDMFFRSNPLPSIACGEGCDFAIQDNANNKPGQDLQLNTGFILLKPNQQTIHLYDEIMNESSTFKDDDQVLFNKIVYRNRSAVKMVVLPPEKFCVGKKSNPSHCIVFHANFVAGLQAKKAMLKRHKFWGYGSSKSELYVCKMK